MSDTPWAAAPNWTAAGSRLVRFMLDQTGPGDVLVFCDGRSRTCRAKLEEMTKSMRNPKEVWVVYKPSPRLGRTVAFGSDNREVILVSLPIAGSELQVKQRQEFSGAGEASTHDSSYTGVPPLPWEALPQVSNEDKAKIVGRIPPTPPARMFDTAVTEGQPLFWAERKPPSFWRRLFWDFGAKSVVDCPPGSGMAARAALDLGIQYLAFARNPAHALWLRSVLDRATVGMVCTSGSHLFQEHTSRHFSNHFKDVLDQLHDEDTAQDTIPESW